MLLAASLSAVSIMLSMLTRFRANAASAFAKSTGALKCILWAAFAASIRGYSTAPAAATTIPSDREMVHLGTSAIHGEPSTNQPLTGSHGSKNSPIDANTLFEHSSTHMLAAVHGEWVHSTCIYAEYCSQQSSASCLRSIVCDTASSTCCCRKCNCCVAYPDTRAPASVLKTLTKQRYQGD